jgi:lysylphosphatidylglycerol synthetase-like protein (DUF2156 family)
MNIIKGILYSICAIIAVLISWILTFVIGMPHLPIWSVFVISVLTAFAAGFLFARKPGRRAAVNLLRALPWTILYLAAGCAILYACIFAVISQPDIETDSLSLPRYSEKKLLISRNVTEPGFNRHALIISARRHAEIIAHAAVKIQQTVATSEETPMASPSQQNVLKSS